MNTHTLPLIEVVESPIESSQYSLTNAQMRWNSLQLSWNTRKCGAKSYKQILNRIVNQFPTRISFGV